MSEEPRRSGRATKGQHKNLDLTPEIPVKRSKAKAQPKEKPPKPSAEPTPAPSEEDEIIRCICGEYEEEEDVERDMICCDKCSAWQHNDCMGLTFAKGEEPAEYFCEQCKPENHQVLLEKIARGEKPWEEAAKKRQQEAEEKKAARRRKGKKGGRRPKASDVKPETTVEAPPTSIATPTPAPPAAVPAAATPVRDEKNGTAPASGQKRKFEEHQEAAPPETGPKPKQQKVSTQGKPVTDQGGKAPTDQAHRAGPAGTPSHPGSVAEETTSGIAGAPEEIVNPARRSCASALVKLFVDQIPEAQKRGSFQLPPGKSAEDVARPLGLSIEYAMYQNICGGSGEPSEPYKSQLRTILFNVKKNTSLRDRLLVGSLTPDALSKMSTQDMASEELQQKDAEIKREAEKQHIIVQEQGPRIRRTHKGEELIEDDNNNIATESIFSAAPARRALDADGTPSAPGSVSPKVQHPPEFSDAQGAARTRSIDTQAANRGADGAWPSIHSPDGTNHDRVFPEVPAHLHEPLPSGKVQADAEIDQLLKDEEPDSPPYSPKDYQDDGIVWRGKVSMNPVAEFSSSAKHVGGADLSGRIPWSQLAPSTLLVDGRIDIQLASNYLCGLRFSSSTDVTVISMAPPESPTERAEFDKLFNYFVERKRYGVMGKHPLPAVKDTYIVPVEAGSTKKPEFIELLENNTLEDRNPDRILLVVFVVKTSDSSNTPSSQPTPHYPGQDVPMNTASPLTATSATPQQSQYLTAGMRAVSQMPSTPSSFAGTPPNHAPYGETAQPQQLPYHQYAPYAQYQPPQSHPPHLTGIAAATQILGPHVKAPAIQDLLQRAPNADASQLNVVRDILAQNPAAANDTTLLMQALVQFQAQANGQQQHSG
ncbi:hypothetical protein VTN02DRAFT_6835 [Thermoascus thermophilus]